VPYILIAETRGFTALPVKTKNFFKERSRLFPIEEERGIV